MIRTTFFHLISLLISTSILHSCSNDDTFLEINQSKDNSPVESVSPTGIEYFWYDDKKYYLEPDSSKFFVVYNDTNIKSKGNVISEGNYSKSNNIITKNNYSHKQKWQILDASNLPQTKSELENSKICYKTTYYKSVKKGNSVGISNLIHIKLKSEEDLNLLEEQMRINNLSLYSQNEFMPLWFTVFCENDINGNALEICRKLHDTNLFAFVEPDFLDNLSLSVTSFQAPNDPYYNLQWNLHDEFSINWPEASSISQGNNVRIGLIDQGVEAIHPDFALSTIFPAFDASNEGEHWFVNGLYGSHGTSCAGIILAQVNNNIGIAGISPKSIIDSYSDPLVSRPNASQHLASDLYVAVGTDDVVSCSWGSNELVSYEIKEAITLYGSWGRNNKGTIIVFSSGNDNSSVLFPANCAEEILVVGATDRNGQRAPFSNYGPELDVMAPGIAIRTLGFTETSTFGYTDFSGTSASCPQVAAIAALILSANPNLTNIEVNDIIEKTARKVGNYSYTMQTNRNNGTWNQYMGYGLVDATAALKLAQSTLK